MRRSNGVLEIKEKLCQMPTEEVKEIQDFVEFLWSRNVKKEARRRIEKLEGIWKGLGFERIDVEKGVSDK